MDIRWQVVGDTITGEFADLPDASGVARITLRLLRRSGYQRSDHSGGPVAHSGNRCCCGPGS